MTKHRHSDPCDKQGEESRRVQPGSFGHPWPQDDGRHDNPWYALLEQFLAYLALEKNYSKHTLEAYARHLQAVIPELTETPKNISITHVKGALARYFSKGQSLAFQAQCISACKHWFRYLYQRGDILDNLGSLLTLPKLAQRLPPLVTEPQIFALLESPDVATNLGFRDRTFLETLYGAGLRISEACGLMLSDLSRTAGTLRVMGKRQKERIIPIPERTVFWLSAYISEGRKTTAPIPAIFVSNKGSPLSRAQAWRVVTRYARRCGMPDCSPHTLRHAFASHLVQHGADLRSVQSLLGHQSLLSTQVYTRVGPRHLQELIITFHMLSQKMGDL